MFHVVVVFYHAVLIIATKQWELVAVTIRGSVLFICSMKASFSLSLSSRIYTESDWMEAKPYFLPLKNVRWSFDNEKMQKIKLNRKDTVFVDI